jgi:hypothetical protein
MRSIVSNANAGRPVLATGACGSIKALSTTSDVMRIIKNMPSNARIMTMWAGADDASAAGTMANFETRGDYMLRLKGDEIPLGARIIAVADSYDAMTTDRPYQKAVSREAALETLNRLAGPRLDAECVAAFERLHTDV